MATLNLDTYTETKNISRVLLLAKVQHFMVYIYICFAYMYFTFH